jgi:hypothetical protein
MVRGAARIGLTFTLAAARDSRGELEGRMPAFLTCPTWTGPPNRKAILHGWSSTTASTTRPPPGEWQPTSSLESCGLRMSGSQHRR